MFAAFCGYLVVKHVTLPLAAVVGLGLLIGAVMSLLIQVLAFEQIIRRAKDAHTAEMQILIGGIGVAAIPLAIAAEETKSNPFGFSGGSSFQTSIYDVAGVRITDIQLLIMAAALIIGVGSALWLRRSRHGLALRSIGVDAEVASLMGIDRRRMALATMAFSGALSGLAGVLFTYHLGAINPESGDVLLVKAFAVIILGGIGSTLGVAIGAFVLAFAETIVLTETSGLWVDAVSFGLIFLVLVVRPAGLFGQREVRRT
jgi:branched-chain amino acid transport system permease protein